MDEAGRCYYFIHFLHSLACWQRIFAELPGHIMNLFWTLHRLASVCISSQIMDTWSVDEVVDVAFW